MLFFTACLLSVVAISIFCPARTIAKSIHDIEKELRGNGYDKPEVVTDLINFQPSCIGSQFWKQSPAQFKQNNKKGNWTEEYWGKNNLILEAGAPQAFNIWNMLPVSVKVRYKDGNIEWININLWNKGDCGLADYQEVFRLYSRTKKQLKKAAIEKTSEKQRFSSRVKRKWDRYQIGPAILELSFRRREYLVVRLLPAEKGGLSPDTAGHKRQSLGRNLEANVTHDSSGEVVISGIPMINQGKKGYCAPATCARVLLYYGLDVDMHLLAEVMETKERGGTPWREVKYSLRRLASGNPITCKQIRHYDMAKIRQYISSGIPVIWGIPGHLRLIVGYNDKEKMIIYSDTWGQESRYCRMPYDKAKAITYSLYVLQLSK